VVTRGLPSRNRSPSFPDSMIILTQLLNGTGEFAGVLKIKRFIGTEQNERISKIIIGILTQIGNWNHIVPLVEPSFELDQLLLHPSYRCACIVQQQMVCYTNGPYRLC
jgi:hypothetical protein